MTIFNIQRIILFVAILVAVDAHSQESNASVIVFDPSKTYQAIDNFAASDAWSCQFVGNWPEEKKNAIADLLFSTDTLKDGTPKGIGLSMWRYNIGDTIKFTSLSPYRIKITGRTKHFINAFGEEVIIENAEAAITKACETTGAIIDNFTAAPVYLEEGKKGRHECPGVCWR